MKTLKSVLQGGGEADLLKAECESQLDKDRVQVLDIGCSDCHFARKYLPALEGREVFHGVEPDCESRLKAKEALPNAVFYKELSEIVPNEQFDLIISVQSAYYLGDLNRVLRNLELMLSSEGSVVFVLWASGCDLYQLAKAQCESPPVTSGELLKAVEQSAGLKVERIQTHKGSIDLDMIGRLSGSELSNLCSLLRRGCELRDSLGERSLTLNDLNLSDLKGYRENSVVTLKRNKVVQTRCGSFRMRSSDL